MQNGQHNNNHKETIMKQYLSIEAEESEISLMGFAALCLTIKEKLEPGYFKKHIQETYLDFSNAIVTKDLPEGQIYGHTKRIFSVMNFFMQFMTDEDYFHESLVDLENLFRGAENEIKEDYLKYLALKRQPEF